MNDLRSCNGNDFGQYARDRFRRCCDQGSDAATGAAGMIVAIAGGAVARLESANAVVVFTAVGDWLLSDASSAAMASARRAAIAASRSVMTVPSDREGGLRIALGRSGLRDATAARSDRQRRTGTDGKRVLNNGIGGQLAASGNFQLAVAIDRADDLIRAGHQDANARRAVVRNVHGIGQIRCGAGQFQRPGARHQGAFAAGERRRVLGVELQRSGIDLDVATEGAGFVKGQRAVARLGHRAKLSKSPTVDASIVTFCIASTLTISGFKTAGNGVSRLIACGPGASANVIVLVVPTNPLA